MMKHLFSFLIIASLLLFGCRSKTQSNFQPELSEQAEESYSLPEEYAEEVIVTGMFFSLTFLPMAPGSRPPCPASMTSVKRLSFPADAGAWKNKARRKAPMIGYSMLNLVAFITKLPAKVIEFFVSLLPSRPKDADYSI